VPGEWSVGHPSEPVPQADDAETGRLVELQAGRVLGEDAGLDGPDSCCFGGLRERGQQGVADPSALRRRGDVDDSVLEVVAERPAAVAVPPVWSAGWMSVARVSSSSRIPVASRSARLRCASRVQCPTSPDT
jgi:hypothetical protein